MALGKGSGKGKGLKRTSETFMCCGKEGHKKANCKFKTATCSNCGKVGHVRAGCRNTNTHDIEMNPVLMSLSKKFGAWLFQTLSTMVTVIALRSTM